MPRVNTTNWQDCKTLTKLMGELANELITYQMHTWPISEQGKGSFGGDQAVVITCINLRDRLNKVIEASAKANAK